ncbi:MAG: vitamin K epoxide reductase family protein [Egibacteraceae bacterium]
MSGQSRELTPPGWRTNPSSWGERLPIVGLALVGLAIALYLTAFQYELVDTIWEPFFGDGSRTVLTSATSTILPVSDGALGAFGYLLDAMTGVIGGTKRWRTMPWIVIVFGIFVGPLGTISILLVIAQPVLYDSYCTLCLASAVISLAMIPPAVDEVLASSQEVKRVWKAGGNWWRFFWGLDSSPVEAGVDPEQYPAAVEGN